MPTTLVVLPTFNEAADLASVVGRLRACVPDVDVLIVDDASPDGTGVIADELASADVGVLVLHRPGKEGLGRAYLAGFAHGLREGYDVICEMDADGSHLPEQLPRLLAASGHADLVIGSRWIAGGDIHHWPRRRQLLSRGANRYVRASLRLGVSDATAGFRAFSADMLRRLDLEHVESAGYCFQVDMTRRVVAAGGSVVEVPITFVERAHGQSKMTGAIVREGLAKVALWGVQARLDRWSRGRAMRRESACRSE